MPMIELADKEGNSRWITVFPFNSLELARSYVAKSSVVLKIIKADPVVYWVCNPGDAEWALKCGYQEIN
jgi:hypothetical protein